MISNYNSFFYQKIIESIVASTDDFLELIKRVYHRSDDNTAAKKIAAILFNYINYDTDIKTNYNALDISYSNDEVGFIPDAQYQRAIAANQDPWTKTKSKSKIGRLVRQILNDNEETKGKFKDSDIESFTNKFKSTWDSIKGKNKKFNIVSGNDILYWYNQKNYLEGNGVLGNSCMRYENRNSFMRIYSENPDKISMVILTEDDKLIGRALIWKLDVSREGKKIFLDRIYTINDSDVDLIYKWVLENVSKNDTNALNRYGSAYDYDDMKINLSKILFPEYPYADSMQYVYKKIENGKIIDEGYISNIRQDDDQFNKSYVLYNIQNVDGSEDLLSHKYSNRTESWIAKDDAVWIDSIEDIIDKKDAIHCKYVNKWYLSDDVVFSEQMDDWIPKSAAITDPDFGIVLKDAILSIITEYLGDNSDPCAIALELEKLDEDNEGNTDSKFEIKKAIRNGGGYFKLDAPPNYNYRNFSNKTLISDIVYTDRPKFLCYKVYGIEQSIPERFLKMISPKYNGHYIYITELDADFFGIKINKNDHEYVYYRQGLNMKAQGYFDYLNIRDEICKDESVKVDHFIHMTSVHNYMMENHSDYNESYKTIQFLDKNKLKDIEKSLIDISFKSVDALLESMGESVKNMIKKQLIYYDHYEPSDNDINLVTTLLKPYYTLYLITSDSHKSKAYLRVIIEEINNELHQVLVNKDIYSIVRSLFLEQLKYALYGLSSDIIDELNDKGGLDNTDIRKNLANSSDIDKIIEIFKNDKELFNLL